jgi:hypothetical protein
MTQKIEDVQQRRVMTTIRQQYITDMSIHGFPNLDQYIDSLMAMIDKKDMQYSILKHELNVLNDAFRDATGLFYDEWITKKAKEILDAKPL